MANIYHLDLGGEWRLTGRQESGLPPRVFKEGDVNVPYSVPGNIEDALVAAGIVPDPYVAKNAIALRPYEFYEWCIVREFDYDGVSRELELLFDGLDCLATVWINGKCLGSSSNAF